jgi:Zn-dependent M28 family amino/carboxypeptidase
MTRIRLLAPFVAFTMAACAGVQTAPAPTVTVDSARLMEDLRILAADSMEGRLAGAPGGLRARSFLIDRFQEIGLQPVLTAGFAQPFSVVGPDGVTREAANLVGQIRGSEDPNTYIVITAHYDHLGVRDGQIYNGADDNASGTAALLEIARHFVANPPRHTIVFAALDAEERGMESGLAGARHFVANPPVPIARIAMNVNLDMVGRNDRNELYAAGTYHYPFLRPYLEAVGASSPITLRFGHDSPDLGSDDWTLQSDHGEFHKAGIPFIYFGVEDHPDYHRHTDTAAGIQPLFYAGATATVLRAVQEFDRNLAVIHRER